MFPVDDVTIERSILEDKAGVLGGIALAAIRTRDAGDSGFAVPGPGPKP
jgi:hypothetical protein